MARQVERIEKRDTAIFEITHVARRQSQLVRLRRCGYEHVGLRASLADRAEISAQFAGAPSNRSSYRKDLALFGQEPLEPVFDPSVRFTAQSEVDLFHGDSA